MSQTPAIRDAQAGHVYLVGGGPGDPDLLTLRAHHLLRTATHVLPDGLISREVLALVNQGATVLPVGKRCGRPGVRQEEINALLCSLALDGNAVVRLKSGDPLVFGRAQEEMDALRKAGIPFEVVPGITAAFAAAATLAIPLTDRASASKLVLATAHYAARKASAASDLQPVWEGPLPPDATVVFYMPGPHLEELAARLIRAGIDRETPVVAISRISSQEQRTTYANLASLGTAECGPAPILLLVGESVRDRR